jgi:hypothetical protein
MLTQAIQTLKHAKAHTPGSPNTLAGMKLQTFIFEHARTGIDRSRSRIAALTGPAVQNSPSPSIMCSPGTQDLAFFYMCLDDCIDCPLRTCKDDPVTQALAAETLRDKKGIYGTITYVIAQLRFDKWLTCQ